MASFIKSSILLFLLVTFVTVCRAQEGHSRYEIKYYVALYTLGRGWEKGKPAGEQEYFKEHSAHLAALRRQKKIRLGARYADTGMVVLRAGTEDEARTLVEDDPAIKNHLFKVAVFEFSPFYGGCLD